MKKVIATVTLALMLPVSAGAFCGFYVSGSEKKMFADATQVVLMRSGTRTVLSMQNDYRGPLEDFAMVIPVPVVLKPTDVKVVPKAVFERVDSLGSPRLVEYWEQDPCPPPEPKYDRRDRDRMERTKGMTMSKEALDSPMMEGGGGRAYRPSAPPKEPPHVPPKLASLSVDPMTLTAGVATDVKWQFTYSNEPYPTPTCTVDNGVGVVHSNHPKKLTLEQSTTFKLTCKNDAGQSSKEARINVVKIEAKFDVAEYQILILSAAEAAGLDNWLKINNFKIPDGAEPLLRPYVEAGSKFFVARVDPKKVHEVDGRVALSPLRFHYDSEEFSLPIRLGMANSPGKQDLIVNILSPDKRYEVANYKNVTIPTNFDVKNSVRERFAEFYVALFDKTIEKNPGAVITEYAWTAQPNRGAKCDPCPPVIPEDADMMTLGGDVIGGPITTGAFVLTRLHARYGKADMKDDLRFREGKPIVGGREIWSKQGLEYNSQPSTQNFFQARYAIRHFWTGPIKCKNPQRNMWGGPPDGRANNMAIASKTAFAPRGKFQLASAIKRDLWEIGFKKAVPVPKTAPAPNKTMWFGGGALVALLGLGALYRRRRDRSRVS